MDITLDELMITRSIECGNKRAHNYKPQFAGVTNKKNYDLMRHGGDFNEFAEKQIEAVAAECAVAEYLGLSDYQPFNGGFKDVADVGFNVEVKHSSRDDANLIVSAIDRDKDIAVLVTGRCPSFRLIGWLPVKECKNDKYRSSLLLGDSYLIPRGNLKLISDLVMSGDTAYEREYSL